MQFQREIEEQFPPPREGEPPSLRADIADELADHLATSAERQMGQGADVEAARKSALQRFGDPAALARRLWIDAMKERIMKDRILIGAVIALTIACAAATAMAWVMLRENTAVNGRLLAALEKMQSAAAAPVLPLPTDKAIAIVNIRKKDKSGAPDVLVQMTGHPFSDASETLSDKTGSDGTVRFGPIKAGSFQIVLSTTDGLLKRELYKNVVVFGGHDQSFDLTIPDPVPAAAVLSLNWPDSLKGKGIVAIVSGIGGTETEGEWIERTGELLIDDENRVYRFARRDGFNLEATPDMLPRLRTTSNTFFQVSLLSVTQSDQLAVMAGEFVAPRLSFWLRLPEHDKNGNWACRPLAGAQDEIKTISSCVISAGEKKEWMLDVQPSSYQHAVEALPSAKN